LVPAEGLAHTGAGRRPACRPVASSPPRTARRRCA